MYIMQKEDLRMQQRINPNQWRWVHYQNIVHEITVKHNKKEIEDYLLRAFIKQQSKREILLPYNFQWVLYTVLYIHIILFRLLDISVIDELHVWSFHFILHIIQFDQSRIQVMDSLRKNLSKWAPLQKILQK